MSFQYERSNVLRGVHFGPGTSCNFDINWWVNELKAMGIGWVKIVDDAGSMYNFARACRQAGIMPIIRLWRKWPNPGTLTPKDLAAIARYVGDGITRWFEGNNEGNLPDEWQNKLLPQPIEEAAKICAKNFIIDAVSIIDRGGYPAIPALAQCAHHGDCSSIRFWIAFFEWLHNNEHEKMDWVLQNGAWLAVHCATLNHAWVEDGQWHFEHPYNRNKTAYDDDCSIMGYVVPRDEIFKHWQRRIPILSTEGGVFHIFRQWDTTYDWWVRNSQEHGIGSFELYRWLERHVLGEGGQDPHPWWFAMCPWILVQDKVGHGGVWEHEAWYPNMQSPLPVVQLLKDYPPRDIIDGNGGNGGNGPEPPPPDVEFVGLSQEMIDRLTITPAPDANKPHWKVVKVEVQPTTGNGSAFAIMPSTFSGRVMFAWGSADDEMFFAEPKADIYAPVGAREWAASMPMFAGWGSYSVTMPTPSEAISGIGLYGDNLEIDRIANHPVLVTFQWVEPEPEPQPPTYARGIDVSAWQKTIDWDRVATADLDFVKIRCTQWDKDTRSIVKDQHFDRNESEAKRIGLLRGAYHFLRADVGVLQQASIVASIIEDCGLELYLGIDVEDGDNPLSYDQVLNFAQAIRNLLQRPVEIYTSKHMWTDVFGFEGNAGVKQLWVADWLNTEKPALPPAWTAWEWWQHTSDGSIPGIQGRVDLNRFNGSPAELRDKYGGPPPPPPGFPRPPRDNGLGIHFSVDDITVPGVERQIAWAKEMKLRWATVADGSREVFVRAAAQVWAEGIMPVCRWIGNIGIAHDFAEDARALIAAGVPPYVQIFNEPSDPREWPGEVPRDYVDKWAQLWAVKASEVAKVGGFPGLQCLHPKELEAVFDYLPPDDPTWRRAWFCSHNYGVNHPPDWHGDYWSVLGFLDLAAIFEKWLGFVPPIICGEGGWLYGASKDTNFPRVGDKLHAQYHKELFQWFSSGVLSDGQPLPDYLFAVCPWILAGRGSEPWYGDTVKQATIDAVRSIPDFVRGEQPWSPPVDALKAEALAPIDRIPLPDYFALVSYAAERGYTIQAANPGQFRDEATGILWAWQAFSNTDQTKFIVAYAIEGQWNRIEHQVIKGG